MRRREFIAVGLMAATRGWTVVGAAVTSIEYEHSRRSWSACNRTVECRLFASGKRLCGFAHACDEAFDRRAQRSMF
jgi:hypothetical protein